MIALLEPGFDLIIIMAADRIPDCPEIITQAMIQVSKDCDEKKRRGCDRFDLPKS
jgi:hypothetical protein